MKSSKTCSGKQLSAKERVESVQAHVPCFWSEEDNESIVDPDAADAFLRRITGVANEGQDLRKRPRTTAASSSKAASRPPDRQYSEERIDVYIYFYFNLIYQ